MPDGRQRLRNNAVPGRPAWNRPMHAVRPTLLILAALLFAGQPVIAHHSHTDFEREERYALHGTLIEIGWHNPHILLHVNDGTRTVRIEWITIAGADKTGAAAERFRPGQEIVVIGSRHRDPEVAVMTLVKELVLPTQDWRWISPSLPSIR